MTESGLSIDSTMTTYDYDNRGRLISEVRIVPGSHIVYDLIYEYDAGGNRTRKVDLENDRETLYTYDVNVIENPNPYDSENNRLMYYEVIEPIGGGVQSTTYYYYSFCGNVTRVVTNPEGTTDYTATRLIYASNGSAVAYVTGETWDSTDPEGTYAITYAREFRYDGSRARYLVRKLDPAGLLLDPPQFNPVDDPGVEPDTWSDYDGNTIYGDFTADAQNMTITETRSYQPGIGRVNDPLVTADAEYYHTDLLGSTRMLSNASSYSAPGSESTYTAFGEPVPGSGSHRYGYAGEWGYQGPTSGTPGAPYASDFPFLHVGARYYDPATGRFLQRDPIGIAGGLNVYAYANSCPRKFVDVSGRWPKDVAGDILRTRQVFISGSPPKKLLRETQGQLA